MAMPRGVWIQLRKLAKRGMMSIGVSLDCVSDDLGEGLGLGRGPWADVRAPLRQVLQAQFSESLVDHPPHFGCTG